MSKLRKWYRGIYKARQFALLFLSSAGVLLTSTSAAEVAGSASAAGGVPTAWELQPRSHSSFRLFNPATLVFNSSTKGFAQAPIQSTRSESYQQPPLITSVTESGKAFNSPAFSKRLRSDLRALVVGPASLDRRGWTRLSAGVALVGAVSLLDDEVRSAVEPGGRGSGVARTIRPLGQELSLAVLGGAWLVGKSTGSERFRSIARDGIEASFFASGLIAPLAKRLAGRGRPINGFDSRTLRSGNESFPSGEATQAFAVAAVISAHSEKKWVKALAWGVASGVAYQRIELDAHWASDVTAGALLGSAMGRWVVRRHRPELPEVSSWSISPQIGSKSAGVAARWTH